MSSMEARQRDVSSGRDLAYFSTNSEKVRRVGCMSRDFPQLSWPGEAGLGPRNCDELDLQNHLGRAFQALTVLSIIISQIADAAQTTRLTPFGTPQEATSYVRPTSSGRGGAVNLHHIV
jgi:hypothetical protein